jgi:hypothetical protein
MRCCSVACGRLSAVSEHDAPAVWNSRLVNRQAGLSGKPMQLPPATGCPLLACRSAQDSDLLPALIAQEAGDANLADALRLPEIAIRLPRQTPRSLMYYSNELASFCSSNADLMDAQLPACR